MNDSDFKQKRNTLPLTIKLVSVSDNIPSSPSPKKDYVVDFKTNELYIHSFRIYATENVEILINRKDNGVYSVSGVSDSDFDAKYDSGENGRWITDNKLFFIKKEEWLEFNFDSTFPIYNLCFIAADVSTSATVYIEAY